jgi:hypothetical protein
MLFFYSDEMVKCLHNAKFWWHSNFNILLPSPLALSACGAILQNRWSCSQHNFQPFHKQLKNGGRLSFWQGREYYILFKKGVLGRLAHIMLTQTSELMLCNCIYLFTGAPSYGLSLKVPLMLGGRNWSESKISSLEC